MGISQKDVKILWGRAANRCSMCRIELTENKVAVNSAFPIGEQAHIVAEESEGPRGASTLTLEERNSYYNLVLLCPTCHTIIDKNEEDYPAERLFIIKSKHESWVKEQLSKDYTVQKPATKPMYQFLSTAQELKPVFWWLYESIPAAQAESFYRSWQKLLLHDEIIFVNAPKTLIIGLENLVRPFTSGDISQGKGLTKLYFANKSIGRHFQERGIYWEMVVNQEHLHLIKLEDMLSQTDYNCRQVLKELKTADGYEQGTIRIVLVMLKYWRLCLKKGQYIDMSEIMIKEFTSFLDFCCSETIGFNLPDSLNNAELEALKNECYGEWSE